MFIFFSSMSSFKIFFLTFIFIFEREIQSVNGGGSEREGDTESKAVSTPVANTELSAQSVMRGSNSQTVRS